MKTLVAFDGSEFSKRALETALQSKKPDDNLVIVSAVPMLPWDPFMSSSQLKEINEESFKRQLDSIREQVDQICKEKAVSRFEIHKLMSRYLITNLQLSLQMISERNLNRW